MKNPDKRSVFIPLFQRGWHTRAVLEGVFAHFQPEAIHIATLPEEIEALSHAVNSWDCGPVVFHNEEYFFGEGTLNKAALCRRIESLPKLYQPGWFYQQMLKLGCQESIPELNDWTLIWDSDLIPVKGWDSEIDGTPAFALLQHNSKGNPTIVNAWETWINDLVGVPALKDPDGTFIPHHMWFPREPLGELLQKWERDFEAPWQIGLIDQLTKYETFSEFWIVASWLASKYPECIAYHPYSVAGETTERFFDDGRGRFSCSFKEWYTRARAGDFPEYPSYSDLLEFTTAKYHETGDTLPSSLSLEASTRHIKKEEANRHLEEIRSRWLVRPADADELGLSI